MFKSRLATEKNHLRFLFIGKRRFTSLTPLYVHVRFDTTQRSTSCNTLNKQWNHSVFLNVRVISKMVHHRPKAFLKWKEWHNLRNILWDLLNAAVSRFVHLSCNCASLLDSVDSFSHQHLPVVHSYRISTTNLINYIIRELVIKQLTTLKCWDVISCLLNNTSFMVNNKSIRHNSQSTK